MPTLPRVSHQHDQRLLRHVDGMPAIGDLIGTAAPSELRQRVGELCTFLRSLLIPHMEAAEATLYPELERLLQNRHSMTPMRREHGEVRHLVADLEHLTRGMDDSRLSTRDAVALRRVIFHLHALLKVHLAEEQLYVRVIEHGTTPEAAEALAAAMDHPGYAEPEPA